MQEEHYFLDITYYMLKKINRRPEGGGHRSKSTPPKYAAGRILEYATPEYDVYRL